MKKKNDKSSLKKTKPIKGKEEVYYGIPVSPGFVIGKAFKLETEISTEIPCYSITEKQVPIEIARFETALITTRKQVKAIQEKIAEGMGTEHAEIFNAHLLVIEDRILIEEVINTIEEKRLNVESVFKEIADKYAGIFDKIDDEYLRERSSDIKDVSRRIIQNLMGRESKDLSKLESEVIIVSYDIAPSETATMHKDKVSGFVTDIGGRTSHTAIMARTLEIPAVVGLHDASKKIQSGTMIIVDGNRGIVIVNPTKKTLEKYGKEKTRLDVYEEELAQLRNLPAETIDGYRVRMAANIEMPEDVQSVIDHGAEEIGLYRTEFFYMNRRDLPTEDEQYNAYFNVAKKMYPKPVIVRTLDLGGDKFLSQLDVPQDMNPFLGWRAIRFCLAQPAIFKVQLRAILRASALGNLKMMYPMISGIDELRQANELLKEVKDEFLKDGTSFDKSIEVGAMIEVPSAAITADILAEEVDFFSIGTNDLIQYSMAVDRVNERIAYLYKPTHPAVLRLIKNIVDAGHKHNIWIGVCGEMASEPALALILVGLGVDELSCSSVAIPELKKVFRATKIMEIQKIVNTIMGMQSPNEIYHYAQQFVDEYVPSLLHF